MGRLRQDQRARSHDGSGYDADELAFLAALQEYKRANHRPFPAWSEVLAVLESLGWRRVEGATALPKYGRDAKANDVPGHDGGTPS